MKKITLLFTVILFYSFSMAQAPYLQWSKTYGGSEDDYAFEVEVLMDGFLIGGHTKSFGNGNDKYDMYLIRTDEMGNILWTKTYGGELNEQTSSLKQTQDGGFILSGYTSSWGQGGSEGYIVRVDRNGDTLWTKYYGGYTWDQFSCGIPTRDQGFIFTGYSSVYLMGDQVFVVKTDANGDTIWTQKEGGDHQDYGKYIIQTSDDAFASLGHTWSQGNESMGYLVRLKENGHVSWWNAFGDAGEEYCIWFDQNEDNSFTIVGTTSSWGNGLDDFWLVYTNDDGLPIAWYTYGGESSEVSVGACRDIDNGILIAGNTWSFGVQAPNMFCMKASAEGDSLWSFDWGGQHWEYAYEIKPTFDGGYVVIGRESNISTGDNNIILLKYGPHPTLYNTLQYHHQDLPIEDNQSTFDTMTMQLPAGSILKGLMVYIDTVMHGEIKDLVFTLSHDGVTDTLIDRPGAGGQNIFDAALHIAASCDVQAGIAPLSGIYRPYQLSGFSSGRGAAGDWVLGIHDTESGNEGTLEAWGLRVYYETMVGMGEMPDQGGLEMRIFPNPCSDAMRLRYLIHDIGYLKSDLYGIDGRKIKELIRKEVQPGEHEMIIDVSDLPAGVYFIRLQVGVEIAVRKVVISD